MPGSITPLPVMLSEEDRKVYENLEPPKTIVVRYGYQKLIAELPYDGTAKPGCGSKMVIRTNRGIELAEMLTTTCPNAGCAKSVSRKEMLSYIDNSGGKDYPFTTNGKVLRVAAIEDLNEQSRLDGGKPELVKLCRGHIVDLDLDMRLVEVERLLGGERVIFYYTTGQQYVDFRELVKRLAADLQTRIEMRQVNDREEARLVADYEKCGQHCCCKQFLKVLKPVSMRAAKVQKATLDPQKISGRCGRLMCCLRYEDKTYSDLKKRLPRRKSYVETEDGIGMVLDTQILTQLALVKIGPQPPAAYPVESLRVLSDQEAKEHARKLREQQTEAPSSRSSSKGPRSRSGEPAPRRSDGEPRRPKPGKPLEDHEVESREGTNAADLPPDDAQGSGEVSSGYSNQSSSDQPDQQGQRKRRRRRRRGRGKGGSSNREGSSE